MRKSFLAAALGGALVVATVAQAQQTTPADTTDANPLVATVNGSEIYLMDLVIARENLPAQYRNMPIEMVFTPLLQRAIQRRLLAREAEQGDLTDNAEVMRRIAFAREEILAQAYLGHLIEQNVTPDSVKARYDAELKDAPTRDEVRARHILVESLEEAEAILVEIRGGADFADIAKKRSTGPTGAKGGDLGFFSEGDMVPEFSTAAFSLAPGQVSDPVKTEFGWHVIKVEERREGVPASLEDRTPELRQTMQREVVESEIKRLEGAASIESFNPDGTRQEGAPKQ